MQGGTSPKAQPFSEHVRELRRRLTYSIATFFLGSIIGFFIYQPLFSLIRRPLHEQLYYTTPMGGFNAVIKISMVFGVIVSVPVLMYQVGKFVSPAFRGRIRAARVILFSVFLGALGVLFAYFVSVPAALHFLANVDSKDLHSIITVNEYLNFVAAYLGSFALLFQLPLIMLFINRIKPQRPRSLMRIQRWVILISFIVAAVLTPTPDPVNQTIMAAPIILLYQFSVVLIWFVNRRRKIITVEPVPIVAWPTTNSVPQAPTAVSTRQPQPIMDIFWEPQNPAI
jgi:sec-independent protein translocase protein TatC